MNEIDPGSRIGAVTLRVADLERERRFYAEAIGLSELPPGDAATGEVASFGAPDGERPLLHLIADPAAPPRPARTTGLFHFAVLVPDRAELARSIARLVRAGWRLTGASDHLVSEAIYLEDPEGNGIEIYRDRPRSEWRRENGELAMATLPLDLRSVMAELGDDDPGERVAAGTTIGHIHLNVADLDAAERFYAGELGFEVIVRGYPGALFVAAGGYHHHLGLNTWNGRGAPAPPPGSLGLELYEILVPGLKEPRDLTDPSGIRLRLVGVDPS